MEFDDVFEYIGDFGLYQLVLFLLLGLTSYYPGWQNMGMTILGANMDHWCQVQRLQNFSYDQQKYIAIPFETDADEYSQCDAFDIDYYNYTDEDYYEWERLAEDTTPVYECESWVYDKSEFIETAVSKYNLVCADSYLLSLSSTIYLCGMLVGALLSGFVSDAFGRKTVLLVTTVLHIVTAVAAAFAPGYWSFTILRFLVSISSHVAFLCAFVILMEITAPKNRTILSTFFHIFFSFGYMTLPVMAYFVRDFFYIQLCMATPVLLSLSYIFLVPESPRWLISKGRYEEAKAILDDLAAVNHIELPDHIDFRPTVVMEVKPTTGKDCIEIVSADTGATGNGAKDVEQGTILDIIRRPILLKELLIIYLGWFTNSLLYYGLGLNAGTLPGSIFTNVFIGGAIEVPAVFVTAWGMYYVGRKKTMAWGFVIASIANFLCIPVLDTEDLEWLLIFFSMFGKACIKLTFIVIYAYTAELFPTPVRHIAVGSSSMMSRFGGILAPFMGEPLMDVWPPLPSIIFGVTAMVTGILSFLLPETLNKPMPDTFQEAEQLARGEIPDIILNQDPDSGEKTAKVNENLSNGVVNDTFIYGAISREDLSTQL